MRNKSTKKVYSDRTVYDYALLCKRIFTGADPEGAHPARGPPPKIGKNMIFWRKIVIFHTKYPNNFRASVRSVQFF
jgi:hypothetical protein